MINLQSKHIPMRRCIGCNQSKPKSDLLRIVKISSDNDIKIIIDNKKTQGRGTYICKNLDCLKSAKKYHRMDKKLSKKVPDEFYKILESKINNE